MIFLVCVVGDSRKSAHIFKIVVLENTVPSFLPANPSSLGRLYAVQVARDRICLRDSVGVTDAAAALLPPNLQHQ